MPEGVEEASEVDTVYLWEKDYSSFLIFKTALAYTTAEGLLDSVILTEAIKSNKKSVHKTLDKIRYLWYGYRLTKTDK